MQNIMTIHNLNISAGKHLIIRDLSFDIGVHSITSVVGPSGAGKTTVLRALNRLLDEDASMKVQGDIRFNGTSVMERGLDPYSLRRHVGIVFQKPVIFPISIYKNVVFGAKHTRRISKKEQQALVEDCLKKAFLWEEVENRLHENAVNLSIGQQQRLAIARTLAVGPKVLLFDEPTASLDPESTDKIESLILSLKNQHSIVLVTHEWTQAKRLSDQIIEISPSSEGAIGKVFSAESWQENLIH